MDTHDTATPHCMGCKKPIHDEPFLHESALGVTIVAHDEHCCLDAYEHVVLEHLHRMRAHVTRWTHALEYDHAPQHDDLMRGVHE